MGASHTVNASREDVVEATLKICPRGVQYAIAAVGSTKAMLNALHVLGAGGAMIIVGAPPDGAMLDLDSLLTGHHRLDEADKAFEVLAKGGPGRGLITFDQ